MGCTLKLYIQLTVMHIIESKMFSHLLSYQRNICRVLSRNVTRVLSADNLLCLWIGHNHADRSAHVYFSPLSVDSRPIGRPTRSQPTVDRLSADCRLTVGQWVSPTIFQYHLKNETGPRFRGGADSNTGLLTGFGSKPFQMPHWKVRERLRCGETDVSSVSQLCRRRRIYTL